MYNHLDSNDKLYNMFDKIFREDFSTKSIEAEFSEFLEKGIRLIKIIKDKHYINSGTEIKKISVMLSGRCHIIKYTVDGKNIVVDSMSGVQMFGIYEILNKIDCYTSSIHCTEDSYFIEIPVYIINRQLSEDIKLSNIILKYSAYLIDRAYEKSYKEIVSTSEQTVLSYIYDNCVGENLPHKILIDRKTMASELNISLRSLYRQIECLKKLGIVSINCGKIMVDQCQFQLIEERMKVNS